MAVVRTWGGFPGVAQGRIFPGRMNTFNMDCGWVVIVPAAQKEAALASATSRSITGVKSGWAERKVSITAPRDERMHCRVSIDFRFLIQSLFQALSGSGVPYTSRGAVMATLVSYVFRIFQHHWKSRVGLQLPGPPSGFLRDCCNTGSRHWY